MTSLRNAILFALATGLCLLLVEGLASAALSAFELLRGGSPEATRYDAELGWVGIPNAEVPDLYGEGRYVRTNARGFRNEADFDAATPQGRLRVICSGDSFTYGQGVANHETFCHRLGELDARIEAPNLGLPGYGVDQMYLRYLRDGSELEHSVHLFAFVHGDLDRMARPEQSGFGKPVLSLEDGELVVGNVPVPWLRWSIARALDRAGLRSVEFATRLRGRLAPSGPIEPAQVDAVGRVARAVFRAVRDLAEQRDVAVLFVYLPTQRDLEQVSPWRGWLASAMQELGAPYADLSPALAALPAGRAASFFLLPGQPGAGHYSEAGHAWVAGELYERLSALPAVGDRLAPPAR